MCILLLKLSDDRGQCLLTSHPSCYCYYYCYFNHYCNCYFYCYCQVESQTVPLHFTPFLGILSGAALTLLLIAILVVLIIRSFEIAIFLFVTMTMTMTHTWYFSQTRRRCLWRKIRSCGEISNFYTSVMGRNLEFLHMWFNFKFLHMIDVE